ncbi:MAG: GNAT family N-acetyltransferase [Polyangiaceae bacterium]
MNLPQIDPAYQRAIEIVRDAYVDTIAAVADTTLIRQGDWIQTTTPSSKQRWFNRVVHSRLSAAQAARRVAETLAAYSNNGSDCEWLVWPDTSPSGFDQVLRDHGFQAKERADGLLIGTAKFEEMAPVVGLKVARVQRGEVPQYVELSARGWDAREIDRSLLLERIEQDFSTTEFYWVMKGSEPIGTGEWKRVSSSGYLCGSTVLPQHRGQGAYRALVRHRLAKMHEQGVQVASTIALEGTSAPILEKLGFSSRVPIHYFAHEL